MDPERARMAQEYKRHIGAENMDEFRKYMQDHSEELNEDYARQQVE